MAAHCMSITSIKSSNITTIFLLHPRYITSRLCLASACRLMQEEQGMLTIIKMQQIMYTLTTRLTWHLKRCTQLQERGATRCAHGRHDIPPNYLKYGLPFAMAHLSEIVPSSGCRWAQGAGRSAPSIPGAEGDAVQCCLP